MGWIARVENVKVPPLRVRGAAAEEDEGECSMKRALAILLTLALAICAVTAVAEGQAATGSGLFPSADELFGGYMPSVAFAIGREPDSEEKTEEGLVQTFFNFTDADYGLVSRYLPAECTVSDYSIDGDTLTVSVSKDGRTIYFKYSRGDKTAIVTYPEGTRIEKEAQRATSSTSLLPALTEIFGADQLPSLSKVLNRYPDTSTSENGKNRDVFYNFTQDDYDLFSKYLAEYGCVVADSSASDDVMNFSLMKGNTDFQFIYDYANSVAIIEYARDAEVEPYITPTPAPTPSPTPVPSPTARPDYTESQCYSIAEEYLKNLSWKNLDSLTIHGHTTTSDDNLYTFYIDYSAQNGFGGYNRKTYMISVDKKTGLVLLAYDF